MTDKKELISNIERIISNEELSERDVLQRIKELYDTQMQAMYPVGDSTLHFSDVMSNCLKPSTTNADNPIYSGFKDLDKMTCGFLENEFVIIGARPAMGKTQLLIKFALNISKTTPVLFLEYGLFEQALGARFMAAITDIDSWKIARKTLSQSEWNQLDRRIAPFYKHHLFINPHPETDIDVLKAQCIQKIEEEHIKVVMIDCIQSLHSRRHYRNRYAEMTYISNELKQLAREQHVCVIAASNLNRSVETRVTMRNRERDIQPQLSDLRDSGAIEQDADKVLFLHRPEYYRIFQDAQGNDLRDKAEIIVAKNPCSYTGIVMIRNHRGNFYDEDYDIQMPFSQKRLDEIGNTCPY